jgi:hypothetical protein
MISGPGHILSKQLSPVCSHGFEGLCTIPDSGFLLSMFMFALPHSLGDPTVAYYFFNSFTPLNVVENVFSWPEYKVSTD